jgi:SAM-dependent methyltransferase
MFLACLQKYIVISNIFKRFRSTQLLNDFLFKVGTLFTGSKVSTDKDRQEILEVNPDFLSELNFWDLELSLNGPYVEEMMCRTDPEQQHKVYPWYIQPLINELTERNSQIPKVLDVGSGPISILSFGDQQSYFDLVSVDPLADKYEDLLNKYKFKRSNKLVRGFGEDLTNLFGLNVFDLIWMYNALDHCQNPQLVFKELVNVLKQGGYLFIQGQSREGTATGWKGLHHHDLYIAPGGKLMCGSINRRNESISVSCLSDGFPLELVEASEPSEEVHEWVRLVWRKVSG